VDSLDRARLNFGRVSGLHVQDQLRLRPLVIDLAP